MRYNRCVIQHHQVFRCQRGDAIPHGLKIVQHGCSEMKLVLNLRCAAGVAAAAAVCLHSNRDRCMCARRAFQMMPTHLAAIDDPRDVGHGAAVVFNRTSDGECGSGRRAAAARPGLIQKGLQAVLKGGKLCCGVRLTVHLRLRADPRRLQ